MDHRSLGQIKNWLHFGLVAWEANIHNYSFMKNFQFIELLKLRGSYGVTGKVNFPPYAAQSIIR